MTGSHEASTAELWTIINDAMQRSPPPLNSSPRIAGPSDNNVQTEKTQSAAELWTIIDDAMQRSSPPLDSSPRIEGPSDNNGHTEKTQTIPETVVGHSASSVTNSVSVSVPTVPDLKNTGASDSMLSGNAKYWSRRITALYERYNPKKLRDKTFVPSILEVVSVLDSF